jgi:hypothetical protein
MFKVVNMYDLSFGNTYLPDVEQDASKTPIHFNLFDIYLIKLKRNSRNN